MDESGALFESLTLHDGELIALHRAAFAGCVIHPLLLVMHVILPRSLVLVSMVPSAFRPAGREMLRWWSV